MFCHFNAEDERKKKQHFGVLCFIISKRVKIEQICAVCGEVALTDQTCQKWLAKPHAGDFSLDDASQLSRAVAAVAVQSLSCVQLFVTPRTVACQASLKLMSIASVVLSNHFILPHLLLLPSIFPSIRVFSDYLALCIRRAKYWSFSFSISPSNEHSVLISFRMD